MAATDFSGELVPALEFTGPRDALRLVYGVIFLAVAACAVALSVMRVDVVVRAPAVVAPAGETARVQSARAGVVDEILVREGQAVTKGQTLVRLDGRRARARLDVLVAQVDAASAHVELLEAVARSRGTTYAVDKNIRGVEQRGVSARLEAARSLIGARDTAHDASQRQERRATALFDRDAIAKSELEIARVDVEGARAQADAARAGVKDLESSLAKLSLERERITRDAIVAGLMDGAAVVVARTERDRLEGALTDARLEAAELEIVAPRAGIAQGIAVFDRGEMVAAGAVVANVVPADEELVVRVEIPPDGIGFVRVSQPVRIKLEAYPFQDFGVFRGEVTRVAEDATRPDSGARRDAGYAAEIRISSAPPPREGAPLHLRAGMRGEAELIVRRERLLAALLRPFRGLFDSVRE